MLDELDPYAILQELGLTDVTGMASVAGDSDTATWRVEQADKVYALRVFQPGPPEEYEREMLIMQVARVAGLPVPVVHASGYWHDRFALLISWLPGRTVGDELLVHPWKVWQLGIIFGQMQANIHALATPDILSPWSDGWIGWSGPDDQLLQQRLRALGHHTDRLLHLDYHPLNVLTDGKMITGVIDWRNAFIGEPRADVARTISILRVDAVSRFNFGERVLLRIFELAYRDGYRQKGVPLNEMSLFYAWTGAVMEHDLAKKRGPEDLARIHAWRVKWEKLAGVRRNYL